jgi:Right handed beta helix region
MMHHSTDRNRLATCFLLLLPLLVVASPGRPAWSQVVNIPVDCSERGQSITQALKFARGQPITITVSGTCNENVAISEGNVTLLTTNEAVIDSPDATKPSILVTADGVTINGFTITGGLNGIIGNGAQRLSIVNCDIEHVAGRGIVLSNTGQAIINHCTISNNSGGIGGFLGSSFAVINSVVSNNAAAGIQLGFSTSAYIGALINETLGGNTIENNGASGIQVAGGSFAVIVNNTITHNGTNPNPNSASPLNDCCAANGLAGIGVFEAGVNIVGGNVIANNGVFGIELRNSHALIGQGDALPRAGQSNTITGNGAGANAAGAGAGILVFGSSLTLRGATISNNTGPGLSVGLGSSVHVVAGPPHTNLTLGANSSDGIRLSLGGQLLLQDPLLSISGNGGFDLDCFGAKAGVAGSLTGIASISPSCTSL